MKQTERRSFFAWPGWPQVLFAYALIVLVSVWFGFVYIGADSFTAHRSFRVRVDLPFESHIPLIPCFTAIYMSIYLLFLAVPFVLRSRQEIVRLATAQSLAIAIAGICFLLVPAPLTYTFPTDSELGIWKSLWHFADRLNLDYNLVPSLHVALSIICIEQFVPHALLPGKILLRSWGILIAASTLFTHQHHVVDVVAGYLLAIAMVWFTVAQHRKNTGDIEIINGV